MKRFALNGLAAGSVLALASAIVLAANPPTSERTIGPNPFTAPAHAPPLTGEALEHAAGPDHLRRDAGQIVLTFEPVSHEIDRN